MPTTAAELKIVAACALVDRDGRVLLAQRPEGQTFAGLWEFPGGKLRQGESPEAALVRELAEEIGVSVAAHCLAPVAFASHRYPTFHLLLTLFACRSWGGNAVAREHQTLRWCQRSALRAHPMPPANAGLVAQLIDWL